ncbi:MAG: S1 family peptidase [Nocardioidaceae bacterium]
MRGLRVPRRSRAFAVVGAVATLAVLGLSTPGAHGQAGASAQRHADHLRQGAQLLDGAPGHGRTATDTAKTLTGRLGVRRSGGAYVRPKSDRVVVTVTTAGAAQVVRAHGAEPQRVRYSSAQLDHVQAVLNDRARATGAGKVQGWYVDVRRNQVVVTVAADADDATTQAFLDRARGFGNRVHVERADGDTATAAHLYGGQAVRLSNRLRCTDGFNATTSDGTSIYLTAGHCAIGSPISSRYGYRIGYTRGYSYPVHDYAAMTIGSPGFWHPQGAVDMHNGYARPIYGRATPAVGARVCKSGSSTGWTCGVVQAKNLTVNYGNGELVYGLVRFNACVVPGDSGGSVMRGNFAAGITSGGSFYRSGRSIVCGQRVGLPNVSYYQPVGPALNAFGATLVTY